MKDLETLNTLTMTHNLLAYIEKVKKAFFDAYNIHIDRGAIKLYMKKFVEKKGATDFYVDILLSTIDDFYKENGEMKY